MFFGGRGLSCCLIGVVGEGVSVPKLLGFFFVVVASGVIFFVLFFCFCT